MGNESINGTRDKLEGKKKPEYVDKTAEIVVLSMDNPEVRITVPESALMDVLEMVLDNLKKQS